MATGAFGDRSGNPGNSFAASSGSSKRNCDGDLATGTGADTGSDAPGGGDAGGTGQTPPTDEVGAEAEQVDGEEPACVLAEDLFAAAKRQAGPAITTAGIFGKPKLAAIFSGRKVDPEAFDADFLSTPCTPGESDPPPYCRGTGRAPDGYAPNDDVVMTEVIGTVNEGVPAGRPARVTVTVLRGRRVVRRFAATDRSAAITHRLRLEAERLLARGVYAVRIHVTGGDERISTRLTVRRI